LFGVAGGDANNSGVIFELSQSGGSWLFSVLHTFTGPDGIQPNNLMLDGAGNLYGVANYGDKAGCINQSGCGTVFKLSPIAGTKE
jgi:hypothetical protein